MLEWDDAVIFDHDKIPQYEGFINKFWNASRYIALKAQETYGKKKITLSSIEKELEKMSSISKISIYGFWIK